MFKDDRGVTTVEWLGMATIAVLVIAFLLPQVRNSAGDMWTSISSQVTSYFG
jgi:Flp pilus assembly pilin Flp